MTRLITLGFENQSELLLGQCDTNNVRITSVYGGTPGLGLPGLETSRNVLQIQNGNSSWQYLFGSDIPELYFVGTFYCSYLMNGYQIITFDTKTNWDFGSTLNIVWNTNGSISLRRGTTVLATSAASLIALNTKYTIECHVKPRNSAGMFTVKIDGVQVVTSGSMDTTDNAESSGGFKLCMPNNTNCLGWWDDVAVNSVAGDANNTWIGKMQLFPLYVKGAGDVTQLSRGGLDLLANYAQVRDSDYHGITFLQGDENEYDLYTVDQIDLPAGATINNVIVQITGKSTSGMGLVAPMIKAADTESQGSDITLPAAAVLRQQAWEVNPKTSVAWVEADISTLQIGAKIRS